MCFLVQFVTGCVKNQILCMVINYYLFLDNTCLQITYNTGTARPYTSRFATEKNEAATHDRSYRTPAPSVTQCGNANASEHLVREAHDEPQSGHFGVENTFHTLAVAYYWPNMFRIL